jgi:hypothetical protein
VPYRKASIWISLSTGAGVVSHSKAMGTPRQTKMMAIYNILRECI